MHFGQLTKNTTPMCATISRALVMPNYGPVTMNVNEVTCGRCMKTQAYKKALHAAFPIVTVVFDGVAK